MKEVAEGSAAVDANLADHLYQCLGCRACETVCPAGVPFGKLLERGRYQIEQQGELSPGRRGWRRFRALAFERVLPSPWLFQAAMLPASTLQQLSPLLRLVQSLPLPKRLAQLVRMIPRNQTTTQFARVAGDCQVAQVKGNWEIAPARGRRRARVGLFLGCVMRSLFGSVHQATVSVLTHNGCEVVIRKNQWCCGALNVHAGERNFAAKMAARNVRAFSNLGLDAIVVNSAGCGAIMKDYNELLPGDVSAGNFAAKVRDVNEFIGEVALRPTLHTLRGRVTYQDACHLAHGQRVRRQPRASCFARSPVSST